jgi:hypothetical protein
MYQYERGARTRIRYEAVEAKGRRMTLLRLSLARGQALPLAPRADGLGKVGPGVGERLLITLLLLALSGKAASQGARRRRRSMAAHPCNGRRIG